MLNVHNNRFVVPGLQTRDTQGGLKSHVVVNLDTRDDWQGTDINAAWYPFVPFSKVSFDGYQRMRQSRAQPLKPFAGEIPKFHADWHADIMSLPNRVEGLNIERVHVYLRRYGFDIGDYRIVSLKDDVQELLRIFEIDDLSELTKRGHHDVAGYYFQFLERPVCLIWRDEEREARFGPERTEGYLVHELAHACGKRISYYSRGDLPSRVRFGFVLFNVFDQFAVGAALEEGFCEWHRVHYLESIGYPNSALREQVSKTLQVHQEDVHFIARFHNELSDDNKLVAGVYTQAFLIFNTLSRLDPEFLKRANRARFSVRRLRELFNAIDKIDPGLYVKLRDLPFEREALKHMSDYLLALEVMKKSTPTPS